MFVVCAANISPQQAGPAVDGRSQCSCISDDQVELLEGEHLLLRVRQPIK